MTLLQLHSMMKFISIQIPLCTNYMVNKDTYNLNFKDAQIALEAEAYST